VDVHMNKFDNVKRFIYHMISTASKSMKKLSRKNDIVHKKKKSGMREKKVEESRISMTKSMMKSKMET
jgi:hypothetical protein